MRRGLRRASVANHLPCFAISAFKVFLNLTVITHGLFILRHLADLIVDSFALKPPQLMPQRIYQQLTARACDALADEPVGVFEQVLGERDGCPDVLRDHACIIPDGWIDGGSDACRRHLPPNNIPQVFADVAYGDRVEDAGEGAFDAAAGADGRFE